MPRSPSPETPGARQFDARLRAAAKIHLEGVQAQTGGPVRFEALTDFLFEGDRIALMDRQRGIRKPKRLSAALSFRTVYASRPELRPYDDAPGPDGYLRYKWRGNNPDHPENVALRNAMQRRLELIWFYGTASGIYWPVYPVWLVAEEPVERQFVVALDRHQLTAWEQGDQCTDLSRAYALRVVRERVHQPVFRERVLEAYAQRCALCHLGHRQLLEAAHIKPDADGGNPVVPNGIAMCTLHHAAFDAHFLAVRPDYQVEIRPSILTERDGPTLTHALQQMHGARINLPRLRAAHPDAALLHERYLRFRAAL